MRAQPQQQPPPVQRIRLCYAKRGRMRFISHRDFSRAFERAVFRAKIPMAYSSGFNPHPRISYAGAAPTGAASEAEYVEIALAANCDPNDIKAKLLPIMPTGLDILAAVTATHSKFAELLEVSQWRLELRGEHPELTAAVEKFNDAEKVLVSRMTKKGLRTFDARNAVISLNLASISNSEEKKYEILDLVLRHETPAVRPDDILAGLREVAGFELVTPLLAQRVAQGPYDSASGTVGDPLQPDRDASNS